MLSLVGLHFKMRSWRNLEVERGTSHALESLLMSIRIRFDYQKKVKASHTRFPPPRRHAVICRRSAAIFGEGFAEQCPLARPELRAA